MNIKTRLFCSSLGKKFIMAITGLVMFLFVIGHLVGNLQMFLPPEHINAYGHFLHSNWEIIWPARIVLLAAIGLHVWSAIRLSAENKAARPIGYAGDPTPVVTSYASRTMLMSGLIIGAFIVYHLLHYTALVKSINLTGQDFSSFNEVLKDGSTRHDVYKMVVTGFSNPVVSLFYIFAMTLLFLHLSHGIAALFQSLGLRNKAYTAAIAKFAQVASWAIYVGYISIPLSILCGLVK